MKTKQIIQSMVPFKENCPMYFQKVVKCVSYYENDPRHIGFLPKKEHFIELINENTVWKCYLNGIPVTFDHSVGIGYPITKFSLIERFYLDTTGKFLMVLPFQHGSMCAYHLDGLILELQPDIKGCDFHMIGGNIRE